MHTERYCPNLAALDRVAAIRAIHQACMQLAATSDAASEESFDNAPAMGALASLLSQCGHPGFQS